MKPLLFLFLAAFYTAAPVFADDTSFAGKWQITGDVSGTAVEMGCTFDQKESTLTGTCQTGDGEVNITGKTDQQNVTWTYKTTYNGSPLTVTYKGKLNLATKLIRITGTITVEEMSIEGTFTANQSK